MIRQILLILRLAATALLLSALSACSEPPADKVAAPDKVIGATPGPVAQVVKDSPARRRLQQGLELGSEKRYAEAISAFDQAIGLEPDLLEAYYNRAVTYGIQGNIDKEEADYRALLALAEQPPGQNSNQHHGEAPAAAYYNLALLVAARGETEVALGLLDKALQRTRDTDAYYHDLARNKGLAAVRQLAGFRPMMQQYWPEYEKQYVQPRDPRAILLRRPPQPADLDPALHQPPSPPGL